MAGTFPGVSGTQQIDLNGKPLVGAQLSVFDGGTNDLSDTFQDIGLAIPGPNPLIADQSGRIPLFFVADGTYKVRLVDQYGSIANGGFEYLQCPSIGASSSGGGGTAVDATTVASTGDIKARPIDDVLTGWTRMNGRTIGNAGSGASERASADTQALFLYLYNTFSDTICPVSGGRTGSALNDFNSGKTITVLDARFRVFVGIDTMGNAAAGRSTGAVFSSGSASTPASVGGEAAHQLIINELAAHTHTETGHHHSMPPIAPGTSGVQAGADFNTVPTTGAVLSTADASVVLANTGGNIAHNTMPPFFTGTWYMKL